MRLIPALSVLACAGLLFACGDKGEGTDGTDGTDGPVDNDGDGFDETEDCDDDNPDVNPAAIENCDGIDNDCDGDIDDDDSAVVLATGGTFYGDADGDGYGDASVVVEACDMPEGAAATDDDCDDTDPAINPGATEVCDDADTDEDCSGAADDDDTGTDPASQTVLFPDGDGDGYGDADDPGTGYCDPPSGLVEDGTDCDDGDAAIHPAATEICDSADEDEDCDGVSDDADPNIDPSTQTRYWPDLDTDGFGDDIDPGALYCDPPSGVVTDQTDCNDLIYEVNPAATEVCDDADVDEDCSGTADDADAGVDPSTQTTYWPDVDTDGYGDIDDPGTLYCDAPSGVVTDQTDCDDGDFDVNPAATEVCDGVDNDCSSGTSEAGMVSHTDAAGTLTDLTSSFSAGTSTTPVAYTASDAGTLWFCDSTFYTNVTVEADVTLQGVAGTEVLDGALTGSVVDIQTDALTVAIQDLTLQNGFGTGDVSGLGAGYESGGGINCAGTASLSLDRVTVSENLAELGGGIATTGCTLDVIDSTLTGNSAAQGGGAFLADGTVTFTTSTVELNDASGVSSSSGGALYAWTGSVIDLDDTVVEANTAEYAGGVYNHGGALTCTSTSTTDGGFFGNVGNDLGGGIYHRNGLAGSTFTATSCDFGASGTSDDNDPSDIDIGYTDTPYITGDDATFTCDDSACGAEASYTVGDTTRSNDTTGYIKGNIFLADIDATLHGFSVYLGPAATCQLDYYLLSNTSAGTSGWTVEWSSIGNTTASSTTDWQDSGDINVVVRDGTYYTLAVGFLCDGSDEVDYVFTNNTTTDDGGFGDHFASMEYGSYTTTLDGSEGVGVYSSSSRARYYMNLDITEL